MDKLELKFAAFTRVSTEEQGQDGASLDVQREAIEETVARMKGRVVGWYGGVEHGTDQFARPEFKRLLADAEAQKFDAVMCYDPSRFGRSLTDLLEAIKVFSHARIRLFMLGSETKLDEPDHQLQMHIHGAVGQHFAATQKRKSIASRIRDARLGVPTSGIPPYGRTYDRETKTWSIDPKAKATMEKAAKLYLQGLTFMKLEKRLGIDFNTIRRRLLSAGSEFRQRFRQDGRVVEVMTKVPPLLSDEVIKAIKAQAVDNRLSVTRIRCYPLANLVRCAHCGSVMSGHTPSGQETWTYYRHHRYTIKGSECTVAIRADEIEKQIAYDLWKVLRSEKGLRKAIEDALNNAHSGRDKLDEEKAQRVDRLADIDRQQNNVVEMAAQSGTAMKAKLLAKWDKLEGAKAEHAERIAEIDRQLPQLDIPKDLASRVESMFGKLVKAGGPMHWKPEQQKELALLMLGGPIHWRRPEDKNRGVFVRTIERNGEKFWEYELKGAMAVGGGSVGAEQEGNQVSYGVAATKKVPVDSLAAIAAGVREPVYKVSQGHRRSSA